MDYDGNDISCHNLQLAGEGKTKSSSVLQPYDFPKFDFGEGLQGHLKFDSLVETEVFLGIQSQEDSQWIEDFSRESNGMEFDSTPGDSCSISRRDNVWSEATSSESVEMLLKSVGQEETMPDKSVIQEPNACDDHGTLAKNVESVINMDEKSDRYAVNSEAVHEDEFLKDSPASKMHVEEELPEFEAASPTLVSGEGGTSDERKRSFQDDNLIEPKAFAETSMSSGAGEDSLHVADGIIYNAGAPSTLEGLELVNADIPQEGCNDGGEKHVSTSKGLEDSKSLEGKIGEASEANSTVCSSFCSVKELGGLNNQDTVGVRLDCVREDIEGESQMKSSKRDERNALYSISTETGKHELEKFPARPMVGPFEGFFDGSSINGLDKHSAELGGLDAGQFASPEQKRDHCLSLASRADGDKLEDLSLSSVESDSIAKMPIFHSDDKKIPVESSSYNNETNASESSDMPMFSSAVGNKQTENVEGCHNDSVAPIQEPGELLVIASKNDSKQVTEEKLANRQVDFSKLEQDICKIKERDEKQPISKNAGSLITDEMTESLDLSKRVIVNNDRKLQHQTAGKMELDNDVDPYATSRTAARLKDDPENGEGEAAVIGSSLPDNDCTETAARVESGANVSTELDSVVQVSKDSMAYDAAGIPSTKMAAERPQRLNKSNDTNVSKSPSMEDMNSICSNHPQFDVGCGKSSLKESVDTDLVSGRSLDIVTMKVEGEKESAQAAELDKTSCGSPTIISSSEPSQMDKEQEETEGSVTTDKIIEGSQSASGNAKSNDALGDDTSFTFKVNVSPDTAEGEPGTGRSWSPVPNADKCKSSVVAGEASPSVKGKAARTPSKKNPRQSARVSDGEPVDGTPKGTSERKGRRASAKGVAKENAKKGKKETDASQESAAVKGAKSSTTRLSISSSSPHGQFGMTQPYGLIEQSNTKLSSAVAAPHLSTNNASPAASFRPPFTDLQQVQLRAQIFVYGSLIQGTAPDEACMASAFGPSDGGRSIWEPVWRAAVERVRIQKSNSTAPETPLHSQSGARASDSAVKESSLSNKVLPSPVGRSNSKGTPAAVVNPIIPLSSPLWSNSTPFRDSLPSNVSHKVPTLDYPHTVTPLHAYQTPPIRNFVGQTSWPQTCVPGPWLASPQTSTFNSSICFQPVTMVEPVKLTPAQGASGQLTSGVKHGTTCSGSPTAVASPVQEGVSTLADSKPNATSEKLSMDSKPRKRKKVSGSNPGEVSLLSEARSEPVVVSNVATNLSLPVTVPAPASPVPSILNKAAGDALTVCPVDHLKQGNMDTAAAATCSEETMNNVAEARNHAENAAALAAAAIGHSENVWSQLAKQKESGLTTEAEVKLASASVAIAAAASVAKAAAAAAKVAYSAALQAKQMVDEAFLSSKANGSGRSSVDMHDIGNATPVSILKGANITNQSNSILVAAKEAAKKRVEAASAASKQAENLDAIVKAAELAAAAVSQAGKIVAMGEPLPLSDLMEAGPEGYWKSPHPSTQMAEKVTEKNKELTSTINLGEGAILPANVSKEHLVERGGSESGGHGKTCPSEKSDDPLDGHASLVDGTMEPMHSGDRELKSSRDCTRSETARSSGVVSQLDSTPRTDTAQLGPDESLESVAEDRINEGSVVEVFKDGGGLKSAWYSANVLRLEDGKAYVCYADLLSEEGSANLCEWVPLEGEGDTAPVIRAVHPSTTLPFQATRKRRRAALGDYAWSVGDSVDVWIDDCWWEGVVTEKNEKDETTLKVHFPAQGETSTVRAWNLRTSRSWKDGKWVEWSSSRGNNASEQSDTPQEKRQKLGSSAAPTDQKDTLANDVDSGSVKADEPKLVAFSTSDRTFNIGKATREDKKHAAQRPLRSGQQKEGSKVIFGVPKPGKKRKFMEVSKHFPANRIDKSSETNDSVKFAKYLMPQATASRGWKAPSRNDSKEKRTTESRSRAPSSRKPNRTLTRRDNLNATLAQGNDKSTDNRNDFEESVIHDENQSEKLVAPGSSACEEAPEAPLSSLLANTLHVPSRKPSSSNTRSERVNKGKLAPSVGKLSKIVEEKVHNGNAGNSVTEVTEPRRSNRRIQPTHRLLEGLQSSMIIPKMPSVSHDRGPRNQSGNASAKGK